MDFLDPGMTQTGPSWVARLVEVLQPANARAERLAATEPFAGMDWPDLQFAAGLLSETLLERGARLTVQGKPSFRFWVILEGEALVSADARPLRIARRGDLIGLPSLLYGNASPETTIAVSAIRAFEAGPSEFKQLIRHRPIRQRLLAQAKRRSSAVG
jgi:CRP-like cAMP-binding protein